LKNHRAARLDDGQDDKERAVVVMGVSGPESASTNEETDAAYFSLEKINLRYESR
jgi:hypothetical protein